MGKKNDEAMVLKGLEITRLRVMGYDRSEIVGLLKIKFPGINYQAVARVFTKFDLKDDGLKRLKQEYLELTGKVFDETYPEFFSAEVATNVGVNDNPAEDVGDTKEELVYLNGDDEWGTEQEARKAALHAELKADMAKQFENEAKKRRWEERRNPELGSKREATGE
jgi:hypothetical protein